MALNIKSDVFEVGDVNYTTGTIDPSVTGLAAPVGSLFIRTTDGTPYIKTAATDTDWTILVAGAEDSPRNDNEVIDTTVASGSLPTGGQIFYVLPPTTDETIAFQFSVQGPATNLVVHVGYRMDTANAGNVVLSLNASLTQMGDPDVAPSVVANSTIAPGNDTNYHVTTLTITAAINEDMLAFVQFSRLGSDVGDTHPGNMDVLLLWVEYTPLPPNPIAIFGAALLHWYDANSGVVLTGPAATTIDEWGDRAGTQDLDGPNPNEPTYLTANGDGTPSVQGQSTTQNLALPIAEAVPAAYTVYVFAEVPEQVASQLISVWEVPNLSLRFRIRGSSISNFGPAIFSTGGGAVIPGTTALAPPAGGDVWYLLRIGFGGGDVSSTVDNAGEDAVVATPSGITDNFGEIFDIGSVSDSGLNTILKHVIMVNSHVRDGADHTALVAYIKARHPDITNW